MAGSALRFEIAPCTMPYNGGNLVLNQIYGFDIQPQSNKSRCRVGGSIDSLAHIIGTANPMAMLRTRDLATFFADVSPLKGLDVTDDNDGAVFRFYEREDRGTFMAFPATTANHAAVLARGGGLLVPQTLTVDGSATDGASLDAAFHPVWNAIDPPFVLVDGADFSTAPVATFNSQYFLGPLIENGVEIKGILGADIEFGLTVTGTPQTPGPYPRSRVISDRQAMMTIRAHKSDAITSYFASGVNTSFDLYLQAGANKSDRFPYNSPSHIKLTFTDGDIEVPSHGGDAPNDAEHTWVVRSIGPMTFASGVQIPLP